MTLFWDTLGNPPCDGGGFWDLGSVEAGRFPPQAPAVPPGLGRRGHFVAHYASPNYSQCLIQQSSLPASDIRAAMLHWTSGQGQTGWLPSGFVRASTGRASQWPSLLTHESLDRGTSTPARRPGGLDDVGTNAGGNNHRFSVMQDERGEGVLRAGDQRSEE